MIRDESSEARLLERIADAVQKLVREAPRHEFGRELKMGADGTPTKFVDDLAEREVLRIVEETKDPVVNVLSEEVGYLDRGGDVTLVVDPIDGTTNAARGLPLFNISLALGTDRLSDVHYGLVRNIPTGDTFTAVKGGGAFKNGEPIRTRPFDPESAVISPELGVHAKGEALYLASKKYNVRSFGSAALELCFVAEGSLDLYYMAREKLRVMDIAAGTLIIREAGGRVYDAAGDVLDIPLDIKARTSVVAVGEEASLAILEVFR